MAGVNDRGGSRITLLERGSVDEPIRTSGTSTRTPGPENPAASETCSTTVVEADAHDSFSTTRTGT